MRPAYDVDAIREAEAPLLTSLPDGALMARAAAGLARVCAQLLDGVYGSSVVLLVGTGNNGGDALHAGALLARRGASVTAVTLGEALPSGVSALLRGGGRVATAGSPADAGLVDAADLVVDGLLGIGASGGLRPDAARLADLASTAAAPIVAVDVPSGVDASTGEVPGAAVQADVTVTFGALKPGLVVAPGKHHAGLVEVCDIGLDLPESLIGVVTAEDAALLLPSPEPETDKYRRGVVGVVAGSDTYTGAAVLAVAGALGAGPGMVRFAGVAHPAALVRAAWPEAVVTVVEPGDGEAVVGAGRVQAWVVGSGLGTDDHAASVVRAVLGTDVPVIVDADAVTVLSEHPEWLRSRDAPTVLTPHAGEFARLRGVERRDVEARRLHHARRAAAELGVTVLLKGSTTVVADPDGSARIDPAGTPWLGTAGSGDVLSGIIGALLAGGLSALDAAGVGSFLHSLAGLEAQGRPAAPITAAQIAAAVPDALRRARS
jgi:hydroxyethylthiazole kinase-like uncharacterized protein yjeF